MKPFVFLIAYLLLVPNINGQVAEDSELYKQLKSVDSLLFEEGFNHCNLEILKSMMHPDLQFLHDQNGMQDRDAFFQGFEESICSNPDFKPIRKLVRGSLQVYPLKNEGKLYGAIQTGIHEFFIAEPGKELRFTVNGKFTHVW